MDNEIAKRFDALEQKVNAIYVSTEKTRKYFLWTMLITLVVVVVPAIGLLFAIPSFLNNYVGGMAGLM
ncbi:MAG: hypothetical protein A3D65_01115 [Candidatus Lloydbacteria bacterium RIFCSPHIGHO2_02_FULL_50_13]|uniref:Uncharacterized protein n=1 Tax=Candidatus Lloydbacteria bacterium RIFCSPHIGHO2_02_FULL_50_13 TaxID=1798661 RepID=A0A1G2D6A5_9BACT|nr:MAG: hypothetical protein A3D65_01115 [Candidatus Lloydbacteria bacterium RIFCSPHIGHO2_02_FULL_50_13]